MKRILEVVVYQDTREIVLEIRSERNIRCYCNRIKLAYLGDLCHHAVIKTLLTSFGFTKPNNVNLTDLYYRTISEMQENEDKFNQLRDIEYKLDIYSTKYYELTFDESYRITHCVEL